MSDHQYERSIAADGFFDLGTLGRSESVDDRIQTALPGKGFITVADGVVFTVSFADTLSASDIVTLDGVISQYITDVGLGLLVVAPLVEEPETPQAATLPEMLGGGADFRLMSPLLILQTVAAVAGFTHGQDLGEDEDTSGTFQDKLSLPFAVANDNTNQLFVWYYELRVDDGSNRGAEARLYLDDATELAKEDLVGVVDEVTLAVPSQPVGTARGCGGAIVTSLDSGAHNVKVQFRRSGSSGSAFCRRAQILTRLLP